MYKIGQSVKINNLIEEVKEWPKEGTFGVILDEKTYETLCKYEVKQADKNYIYGIVTNTYGHKRTK